MDKSKHNHSTVKMNYKSKYRNKNYNAARQETKSGKHLSRRFKRYYYDYGPSVETLKRRELQRNLRNGLITGLVLLTFTILFFAC